MSKEKKGLCPENNDFGTENIPLSKLVISKTLAKLVKQYTSYSGLFKLELIITYRKVILTVGGLTN